MLISPNSTKKSINGTCNGKDAHFKNSSSSTENGNVTTTSSMSSFVFSEEGIVATSGRLNDNALLSIDPYSSVSTDAIPISIGGSVELCKQRRRKSAKKKTSTVLNRTVSLSSYQSSENDQKNHTTSFNLNIGSNNGTRGYPNGKPLSFISTLINDFQWALNDLGWDCVEHTTTPSANKPGTVSKRTNSTTTKKLIDDRKIQIEKWALFVETSLTKGRRLYNGRTTSANKNMNILHSISDNNLFEVTEAASSLQLLAAAFRNVVQFAPSQMKGLGNIVRSDILLSDDILLIPEQQEILHDILVYHNTKDINIWTVHLSDTIASRTDLVICSLFGFEPGNPLTSTQPVDIFLSTIIATRMLRNVLSFSQLAQLATIICATATPTSNPTKVTMNASFLEEIYTRFADCNHQYRMGIEYDTIVETVQLGADLWNRLIGYIATPDDIGLLLNRVWRAMIPERNSDFFEHVKQSDTMSLYNIINYCNDLRAMTVYFSENYSRDNTTNTIYRFGGFHGLPTPAEISGWQHQCYTNLQRLSCYVQSRFISVAIVASFVELTGGGANTITNTFFLGDLKSIRNSNPPRIGDGIPLVLYEKEVVCEKFDHIVYDVLRGVVIDSNLDFDVQRAPLAAYLYKVLGIGEIQEIIASFRLPLNKNEARRLLNAIPISILKVIGQEFYTIAVSRQTRTELLLQHMEQQQFERSRMYFI